MRMDTGSFAMAPLSDFTVTVKNYQKKQIAWETWYREADYPAYDLIDGHKIKFNTEPEPENLQIEMPYNYPPYELIWAE